MPTDRPQSFGLHSPDQLPQSATEFQRIATSFGLQSPENGASLPAATVVAPPEVMDGKEVEDEEDNVEDTCVFHPGYNPRMFCDGGLYLDPDIIGKALVIIRSLGPTE